MYYAYIHEIRLSAVAVCWSEGSKQDAPTLGKSLDSLSRLHQDTGRRCWTVRKQPKSRVQISLLFFFLLCSPSFLLNFSPFFRCGSPLPALPHPGGSHNLPFYVDDPIQAKLREKFFQIN